MLLILVAVAVLTPDHATNTQDFTRVCLSKAIVHGRLTIDSCIDNGIDRARYRGHIYSNKAPGLSMLAIPVGEAVGVHQPATWTYLHDTRLWAVRVATSGLLFLIAAFVVGRMAEGLAPGTGGLVLTTLALGTLLAPFAATSFDHDPTAAFGIVAFALAWSRRPFVAGLAAGAALLCEYESAPLVLVLGAYAAIGGTRSLIRYAAGAAPGAVLLAVYDWAAFGAPWHNPLSYSDNAYKLDHSRGILGIQEPTFHAAERVLVGTGGILVLTPVTAAAAFGLSILWRRGLRAETLVCSSITALYLVAEFGYFDPYGGSSPGPRFFVPAFPFLFLGLGPAIAWRPRLTGLLAISSVIANTTVMLVWSHGSAGSYAQGVWGQLVRFPADGGRSPLYRDLSENIVQHLGLRLGRPLASLIVWECAAAAVLTALPRQHKAAPWTPFSPPV